MRIPSKYTGTRPPGPARVAGAGLAKRGLLEGRQPTWKAAGTPIPAKPPGFLKTTVLPIALGILRRPVESSPATFNPETAYAEWVPLKTVHSQSLEGFVFRKSVQHKIIAGVSLATFAGVTALAALKMTIVGTTVRSAIDTINLGHAYFVLLLMLAPEVIRGLTTSPDQLNQTGPTHWFADYHFSRNFKVLSGLILGTAGFYLLPEPLLQIYNKGTPTDPNTLTTVVFGLPMAIGAYLWTRLLLYCPPAIAGTGIYSWMFNKPIESPPDVGGFIYRMSRQHPLAFGSTYFSVWLWIVGNAMSGAAKFGVWLAGLVQTNALVAVGFALFMYYGYYNIRALFFDRTSVEEKKQGASIWDAAAWLGAKYPRVSRFAAVILGAGIMDAMSVAKFSSATGEVIRSLTPHGGLLRAIFNYSFLDPSGLGNTALLILLTLCGFVLAGKKKVEP